MEGNGEGYAPYQRLERDMRHIGDYRLVGTDRDGKPIGKWTEGCQRLYANVGARPDAGLCECEQELELVHYSKGCGRGKLKSAVYGNVTCKICRRMLRLDK